MARCCTPWWLGGAALALALAAFVELENDPKARWFKGNLHTHSLWSDGNDFPDMIADWYRERGYHFLALSDHNILSAVEKWVSNDLVIRRGGRRALAEYRERFGDDWPATWPIAATGRTAR